MQPRCGPQHLAGWCTAWEAGQLLPGTCLVLGSLYPWKLCSRSLGLTPVAVAKLVVFPTRRLLVESSGSVVGAPKGSEPCWESSQCHPTAVTPGGVGAEVTLTPRPCSGLIQGTQQTPKSGYFGVPRSRQPKIRTRVGQGCRAEPAFPLAGT